MTCLEVGLNFALVEVVETPPNLQARLNEVVNHFSLAKAGSEVNCDPQY